MRFEMFAKLKAALNLFYSYKENGQHLGAALQSSHFVQNVPAMDRINSVWAFAKRFIVHLLKQ